MFSTEANFQTQFLQDCGLLHLGDTLQTWEHLLETLLAVKFPCFRFL